MIVASVRKNCGGGDTAVRKSPFGAEMEKATVSERGIIAEKLRALRPAASKSSRVGNSRSGEQG